MASVGIYGGTSTSNFAGISPYGMGTTPQGTSGFDVNAVMPALMNVINQATTKAQTPAVLSPMEEHKAYWQGLTNDTRLAIEENQEYQQLKMQLMQEFILWCIGGTDLGIAFSNGPGSNTVRDLTALAKKLEPQVTKQRDQEVESLRKQVSDLMQIVNSQSNASSEVQRLKSELDSLKRNLGEDNK